MNRFPAFWVRLQRRAALTIATGPVAAFPALPSSKGEPFSRLWGTEKLVDPDSHLRELHAVLQAIHSKVLTSQRAILGSRDEFENCMRFSNLLRNSALRIGLQFSVAEKLLEIACCFSIHS